MPTARSELLVVDASVVLSVLIDPNPAADSIGRRLATATMLAPAILPFEVANVLRRRRNAGLLSPAEASLAFDGFGDLSIELWPWETVAARVWQLGENLSSYDAAYVALAEQTGATLLTRDRRILGAPGIECRVDAVE